MGRRDAGAVTAEPQDALLRILAEAKSLPSAAGRICALVAGHYGWQVALLWVVDEDHGLLRYSGGWSDDDASLARFKQVCERLTFAPGVGMPGRVWEQAAPDWIPDLGRDGHFPRIEPALEAGLGAAVAVPLIGPGGVVGVLELLARGGREAELEQLRYLNTMGRGLAFYVARLNVEERLSISEETSAAIVQAALDCIITMDHKGNITDFNAAAERTFGFKREDVCGTNLADTIIPPDLREAHRQALERYVETGVATILNRRLEIEAARADGSLFPVELTVTRLGRREPPHFGGFIRDITERRRSEEELGRLLESEHHARLRAEAAERATRTIADTLQRGLLPPRLPSVPHVGLSAVYRAGEEGSVVGGDFYDVFKIEEGRWGFAIGDVSGKGVQAASVTAMMRWTIRTAALREHSPGGVLEILNTALHSDAVRGDYCTAIYGSMTDPGAGELCFRIAIAGHPLPLLCRAGREVVQVGEPGTLLGALPCPRLHQTEFTLRTGDVLLFYTDGVTETRTPEGFFGTGRLAEVLQGCADDDADTIAATIEAALVAAAAESVSDDIALLVVRAE